MIYLIVFIIFLWLILPPIGTVVLARWLQKRCFSFTVVSVATLLAVFVVSSLWPRYVPALDDNMAFSIPMDYRDRYMYGLPFGFWCRYARPQDFSNDMKWWQRVGNRIDPRGAAASSLFWCPLLVSALIPATVQFVRKKKGSANKTDAPDRNNLRFLS